MSEITHSQSKARKRMNNIFILSLIAWTATIAGLFFIYYDNEYDMAISSAKLAAVHSLQKDLLYRKWAAGHGGVYVPVTESNQPNPYLSSVPERDVETTTGKKLTLINSGCMNDEIFKLGLQEYGIYGHNTSLNPINPQHSPDDWERKALLSLQNGGNEYFGLDKIGGSEHFRYMVPMTIRDACLNCHNHQGYKAGDLGGGTVVSVPWDEFQSSFMKEVKTVGGIYGIVWLLGLLGMFGARGMITSEIGKEEATLEALTKSEKMLNTVLQTSPAGVGLLKNRVIQWGNEALTEITGYSLDEILLKPSKQFYETEAEYERVGAVVYPEIAERGKTSVETRFLRKDGAFTEVLMNVAAVDKNDLSAGTVFVIVDVGESKKMAQQLQESLSRLERAEVAAKFGNWELDLNTRRIRASKGAFNIYGLEQQNEIDLETVQKIPLPEYRRKLDEALASAIQNQEPYDIEFKAVRQSDSKIIDIHSIADFDPITNIVWGVIQDITKQKEAEEALIKSEAKYRRLAENMTDIIWSSDPTTKFTFVSASMKNVLGYEAEEAIGKTIFDFLSPVASENLRRIYSERMLSFQQTGVLSSVTYEVEVFRKDKNPIWLEIVSRPNFDSHGNLLGFQGVARDVTGRREAEQAFRDSESRFRTYVESSPIGIFETNAEGIVVAANRAEIEIIGYSVDEFAQMSLLDPVAPQHLAKCREAFESVKRNGQVSLDTQLVTAAGITVWVSITGVKLSENRYLFFSQEVTERKEAEAALRENEERLSLTLEVSNAGCWEWFIETDEVAFDERFHSMLGYQMGELPTALKEWLPYHHEEDMSAWMSKAQECLMGAKPVYESEHRIKSKTGEWKWVFTRGKLVDVGSSESKQRFVGMAMDITERKKAEEALAEREVLYRTLFEGARDAIMVIDMEGDATGRIVSANPVAGNMHGYSLDELTSMTLRDLETPDDSKDLQDRVNTVLSGQTLRGELNHVRKDGSVFPVEISANLVEIGGHKYCMAIDRDISERKLAEEALRESEAKFKSYVESSPIAIFETDFDGAILSVNEASCSITGYSREEQLRMNLLDFATPELRAQYSELLQNYLHSNFLMSDVCITVADGKTKWMLISGVKLSDNRLLFFSQDIDGRKRAEEELIEMERKLLQSQKLESLGVLTGGIAHDFNNLLAAIIGNIELAQENDISSSERELFLEKAMSASMKSASLVRQMLDYSGKGAFQLSEVNLSELVYSNIDMFRMTVPKNINLKVDSSGDDIFVKADVSQIQQVIMNLLINASEALDGKTGTVEITTGAQYCDKSVISKSLLPEKPEPQDMAFIRVRDDGIGMDAETVARIFDPFFSTKFLGRGLGMSVVHGVVRGHKGAAMIDSQPGSGTTISVYLPLLHQAIHMSKADNNLTVGEISDAEDSLRTRKFSVLVVDDEQIVLDLVLAQLQHLNCETFSAMNGKDALKVFGNNPGIDLVILDMVMPEMGGVEAFERLKELKPEVNIVLCSGYNEEKFKDEFKSEFKPLAFITKPYRYSTLKDLIETLRAECPDNVKPLQ